MTRHPSFYPPQVALSLLVLLVLILAGCAPAAAPTTQALPEPTPTVPDEPQAGPLVVTDGLGRAVTLADPAQRIVSLAPSNTEILYAIGAGSQVVARDEFSDFPPEAASLPGIGGSFGDYNNEAIVELNPDLVLAAEINPPELVQDLEKLGLTVFYLKNPVDLAGISTNLQTVGELAGRQAEAAALGEALEQRIAAVDETIAAVQERPLVFYELDGSEPSKPYTAGAGNFIDLLIARAGGRNAGASLETPWAQISIEELVVQDPQIILLGDAAYGVTPESVAQRAGWAGIQAVKEGKVYPFDDNLASRPGPRLVDGLEAMAELLHPELFP